MRLLACAFLAAATLAGHAGNGPTTQRERVTRCDARADAGRLQGEERNQFMVDCLKDGESRGTPQQERSAQCNQAARERRMEGAERRGFLSACTRPPVDRRSRDCLERAREMSLDAADRLRFINGCVEGTRT